MLKKEHDYQAKQFDFRYSRIVTNEIVGNLESDGYKIFIECIIEEEWPSLAKKQYGYLRIVFLFLLLLIIIITTSWQNFYIISISKRIILRSNQAFLRIGYAVALVCHWGSLILYSYRLIANCYFYERLCIYFVYSMYIRNTYDGFRIGDRFDSIVFYWSKIHTLRLLLISFSTSFCKKYK